MSDELLAVELADVGPQRSSDDPFTKRMRLHQSWWRRVVLGLERTGVGGPKRLPYGNYLHPCDAANGLNFLTDEIRALAMGSAGPHVEKSRNEQNLLSSQPMAFNLFGPLVVNPERARRFMGALLGTDLHSASVEIEFTPDKKAHLNDRTSFDVLVRYTDHLGRHGLIAIETKLTEPFSDPSQNSQADKPVYRATAHSARLWAEPESDVFVTTDIWQLWRNHLLLASVRSAVKFDIDTSQLWVVHHDDDQRCVGPIEAYRKTLISPEQNFRALTLGQISEVWQRVATDHEREWLDKFRARYIDLNASDYLAIQ